MEKPVVLVSGAASGLGRAFFAHYASDPSVRVIGIDIRPWPEPESVPPALFTQLDITAPAAALQQWASQHLSHAPLSLVIYSAGIRGLVPAIEAERPADVAAAETLEAMDAATMLRTYNVNVVGALQLIRTVLPNLRAAALLHHRPSKVVVMSSRMGSIGANGAGGGYAYRASKAALNAVVKSLSVDVPEVCFACVHPGRVETGLVKVREEGAVSCEESLRDMLALIERLGAKEELGSGCFVDRWGKEIEW